MVNMINVGTESNLVGEAWNIINQNKDSGNYEFTR
jgi:hypothetical protein